METNASFGKDRRVTAGTIHNAETPCQFAFISKEERTCAHTEHTEFYSTWDTQLSLASSQLSLPSNIISVIWIPGRKWGSSAHCSGPLPSTPAQENNTSSIIWYQKLESPSKEFTVPHLKKTSYAHLLHSPILFYTDQLLQLHALFSSQIHSHLPVVIHYTIYGRAGEKKKKKTSWRKKKFF